MKLTQKILEEASKIMEYIEPEDTTKDSETVLGAMTEEEKQIYTYAMQVRERGKTIMDMIEGTDSIKEKKELTVRAMKLMEFGEFVDGIRWAELSSRFKDYLITAEERRRVGVRKGYQVVSFRRSDPGADLLKKLLG